MKIYIIERDNNEEWIEPEVFTEKQKAFDTVEKEYKNLLEELDITQEDIDKGRGCYACYWEIDEYLTGRVSVQSDYSGDYWHWRITEHEI